MDKDTKNKHETNYNTTKYSHPDERLVEWFEQRLELEQKKSKLESKKMAGGKMPESLRKAMNSSGARKSDILDLVVFPSMANLVYFFDRIYHNPQLNELFEKDVIELLDPRFVQEDINFFNKTKDVSAYSFRSNAFARLILTALKIPAKKMTNDGPVTDFRIALLYQLQSIVRELVQDILIRDYGSSGAITVKAGEDFSDALRWLTFIATAAAQEVEREHRREIYMYAMDVPHRDKD